MKPTKNRIYCNDAKKVEHKGTALTTEEVMKERSSAYEFIDFEEDIQEAAVIYAHKSFVWALNKQGEKQLIPPGQLVPPGYAKHQKTATKHFISGAKWAQKELYTKEDMKKAFNSSSLTDMLDVYDSFEEFMQQFKKK